MRDRYGTRLSPGMRVADLRAGKLQEGRALGPAGQERLRVEWEDGEDEDVLERDIVVAGSMHLTRRRG